MSKKEENTNLDAAVSESTEKQDKKRGEDTLENVIYLGPDIPNVVNSSTVFADGVLPDVVNEKIKELPILSNLFVPVSGMVEKVKELNNAGSFANTIYARIKAETKKEV